jgi:HEAT repeat protein
MRRIGTTPVLALTVALALMGSAGARARESASSEAYREGQRALDDQDWDDASRIFGTLAARSTDEADAALYWKAYADWKRKLKNESLEGLRRLRSSYPKSRWIDDAKALELEIEDGKAARAVAGSNDDEELKLYALDALMQVEPEEAVPVLERVLSGNASPRLKERALFVLSQSDSPRARETLLRTAKSGQPSALRSAAIKTLGIAGLTDDLAAIAREPSTPKEAREAIVEAFLISNEPGALVGIATSDPDPEVRDKAIGALGAMGQLASLRKLWTVEKDPAVRDKLLQALGIAGDVDTLTKVAREGTDPQIRRKAIEGLGISSGPEAGAALRRMYAELPSSDDKRAVAQSLMVHGDSKTLLELFRAEKDPTLKRHLLQQLSIMNDPEVTQIIIDVLGDKP